MVLSEPSARADHDRAAYTLDTLITTPHCHEFLWHSEVRHRAASLQPIRVIFLGDSECGKSRLVNWLVAPGTEIQPPRPRGCRPARTAGNRVAVESDKGGQDVDVCMSKEDESRKSRFSYICRPASLESAFDLHHTTSPNGLPFVMIDTSSLPRSEMIWQHLVEPGCIVCLVFDPASLILDEGVWCESGQLDGTDLSDLDPIASRPSDPVNVIGAAVDPRKEETLRQFTAVLGGWLNRLALYAPGAVVQLVGMALERPEEEAPISLSNQTTEQSGSIKTLEHDESMSETFSRSRQRRETHICRLVRHFASQNASHLNRLHVLPEAIFQPDVDKNDTRGQLGREWVSRLWYNLEQCAVSPLMASRQYSAPASWSQFLPRLYSRFPHQMVVALRPDVNTTRQDEPPLVWSPDSPIEPDQLVPSLQDLTAEAMEEIEEQQACLRHWHQAGRIVWLERHPRLGRIVVLRPRRFARLLSGLLHADLVLGRTRAEVSPSRERLSIGAPDRDTVHLRALVGLQTAADCLAGLDAFQEHGLLMKGFATCLVPPTTFRTVAFVEAATQSASHLTPANGVPRARPTDRDRRPAMHTTSTAKTTASTMAATKKQTLFCVDMSTPKELCDKHLSQLAWFTQSAVRLPPDMLVLPSSDCQRQQQRPILLFPPPVTKPPYLGQHVSRVNAARDESSSRTDSHEPKDNRLTGLRQTWLELSSRQSDATAPHTIVKLACAFAPNEYPFGFYDRLFVLLGELLINLVVRPCNRRLSTKRFTNGDTVLNENDDVMRYRVLRDHCFSTHLADVTISEACSSIEEGNTECQTLANQSNDAIERQYLIKLEASLYEDSELTMKTDPEPEDVNQCDVVELGDWFQRTVSEMLSELRVEVSVLWMNIEHHTNK
ncbi:unnamed protein product [Protopolystoma xenopodis]|uniref:Uncharacterized protein n=1 Tax=Protopolystoma xenopodis TaxID=117903 RepID=A0A448XG28_9PLAT|nr:unnamed protein product [Protopolystoma xenopodis]